MFGKMRYQNKINKMKRVLNFIENNVPLFLTLAAPVGLIFPYFSFLKNSITYLLMIVLFFTFMKMDVLKIIQSFKEPLILLYLVVLDLGVFPLVVFLIFKLFGFDSNYLSAMLLFSAVPAGVASPAFTEIQKGNAPLSVAIVIITHFVAPFTIPLLFFLLLRRVVDINYVGVMLTMLQLIGLPLLLSFIVKYIFKERANFLKERTSLFTLIPLFLITLTVISVNFDFIIRNPLETIKYILISYPVYFLFLFGSLFATSRMSTGDRIAAASTKTFMNISIGIVLSLSFLEAKASLILTLAQIPWSTMMLPASIIAKNLRKKRS